MIGIYKILHKPSGKFYIGQSVNVRIRWAEHRRKLRNNDHHNPKLQSYFNKYGIGAFEFQLVEECNADELDAREQYYLDKKPWFNVAVYASAPTRGRTFSKEVVEKRAKQLRGRAISAEHKQNISKAKKGVKQTEKHKQALSKVRKGKLRPTNRRKVMCVETGQVFDMVKDVAKHFGGRSSHLCGHLSGSRKHFKEHTFKYVEVNPNWKHRGVHKNDSE